MSWIVTTILALCLGTTTVVVGDTPPPCGKPTPEERPLVIHLPPPVYSGTPHDLFSPNLEPTRLGPLPAIMVPKDAVNLAKDALITSDVVPEIGTLDQIVDEKNEAKPEFVVEFPEGPHYIELDLGRVCALYALAFWHFHAEPRIYFDIVVEGSNDPDFFGDTIALFNNDHDNSLGHGVGKDFEYVESSFGRVVQLTGQEARYVRLYSRGSTSGDKNHYVEVMLFGIPPATDNPERD